MPSNRPPTAAVPAPFAPIRRARLDWQDGTPVAPDYGDRYFSSGQGPAESEAVFLAGNRLAERFADLPGDGQFVIGETGFGTGLNALLAADLFLGTAPPGARLSLVSAELHPLERADLARAVAAWPALAGLSAVLVEGWPPATAGFHRLELHPRVDLSLLYGDAAALWSRCDAAVDAWFLDGFAPDRNPDMWSDGLFRALAHRSRPGATAASYTVAGRVRRGLAAAGFRPVRRPGFGPKRERLEAEWPGRWRPRTRIRGEAVVAGAGLAGAAAARALAVRGWTVTVLDPTGVASGASGNRAGIVYTTPSAHPTPQNRFYQSGYLRTLSWLRAMDWPRAEAEGILEGVVQHPVDSRHRDRLALAMTSGVWPEELLQPAGDGSVRFPDAGCIDPGAWCRAMLDHPGIETRPGRVSAVDGERFVLAGGEHVEADCQVLCTGASSLEVAGLEFLPLYATRGQVSECRATTESGPWREAQCHAGYLTPALAGVHSFGATFDRRFDNATATARDDGANLAQLRRHLPGHWQALGGDRIEITGHRAGLRCHSRDYLALCGALPDPAFDPHRSSARVFLSLAHGSRGITSAPLCAEILADRVSARPLPVDSELAAALDPARFILRRRRNEPGWKPGQ